jgi:hypothetical protein
MAFRDQRRRPLILILLVLVPAYVILWSVAETKPTPRTIELPGGEWVNTTMKALHGPGMAGLMVAFLVSAAMMALVFTPASWPPVLAALLLTGLTYAAIGALIGARLDKLPAVYLILFLVMTDLGVVQSPMFHATPTGFAWVLPGYLLDWLLYAGAFSHGFRASGILLLALGWLAALGCAACLLLRRAIATHT